MVEMQMSAMGKRTVSKKTLMEIVRRIVEVAAPDRIILFGSAARGTMGPGSDLDVLVVKKGTYHPRELATRIYMNLYGIDHAIDIVVVTQEQVEKYRNSPYCVIGPAMQEGVVIYDAGTAVAR